MPSKGLELFDSIAELPLDEYEGTDQDDSGLASQPDGFGAPPDDVVASAPARAMALPLKRTLKKGVGGRDVLAVQRALKEADVLDRVPPKNKKGEHIYGLSTENAVERFQRKSKIRVDGEYGKATHAKLRRHFDPYGAWLLQHQPEPTPPEQKRRASIVATAMLGWRKRDQINYTQSTLRMSGVKNEVMPPDVPHWEDCSSFATWCYWVADEHFGNVPNPNGYQGWPPYGFTGTLCANGHAVSLSSAKPGDLVFYGGGAPWGHVAVYVGHHRVSSHGSQVGPSLLSVSYRPIGQIRSYL